MRWRKGKPSKEGLWIVQITTKDYIVVEVEWAIPVESVSGKDKYLAINDGDTHQPLKDYKWALRSFGPVPVK